MQIDHTVQFLVICKIYAVYSLFVINFIPFLLVVSREQT